MKLKLALVILLMAANASAELLNSDQHFFADGQQPAAFCNYRMSYSKGRYTRAGSLMPGAMAMMRAFHKPLQEAVQQYLPADASLVLEVGPLYSPMLNATESRKVVYWEKDLEALRTLESTASENARTNVVGMQIDFNDTTPEYEKSFMEWNRRVLAADPHGKFRAAILSQVLNYVDYRKMLDRVASLQGPGDLMFVLNGVGIGESGIFPGDLIPKGDDDVENYLKGLGYEIIHKDVKVNERHNPSITLVARKL